MKILTKTRRIFLTLSLIILSSGGLFAYQEVAEEEQVELTDPKCHCWDVSVFGVHIVTKCNKYCGDMAGWDWF